MRLKSVFSLLLILIAINSLFCAQVRKKITVLPFINNGNIEYEKLSDYIPSYIILLLKDLPGYAATPLFDVKKSMARKNQDIFDLKNQAVLARIAQDLGTDLMICGYFNDEGSQVFVSFTIYNIDGKSMSMDNKVIRLDVGKTDIFALNTSFDKFMPLIEEITRIDLKPGILTIKADTSCSLFVDGEVYGETPIRIPLYPGKHALSLVHKGKKGDEKVLSENLTIGKGESVSRNFTVFYPLSIKSDDKCTVFINDEERGSTPFDELLYSGREYLVRVLYYNPDGTKIEVYKDIVSTEKPLAPMYFSSRSSIQINSTPQFLGSVATGESTMLPAQFNDLVPGKYRVRVVLPGDDGKERWVFYDENVPVLPFAHIPLDFKTFDYQKMIGLTFIPSASQFYNREPVKGGIVLASFLVAAAFTGISIWQWSYHEAQKQSLQSHYENTPSWLAAANAERLSSIIWTLCTIVGGVLTGLTYGYSMIDGILVTNDMYARIYPGKP